ncbi:MAG TPA: cytochrome c [Zoogloea sp.]|uniref:cytochrome c n=1 Tax=Zoogloea sp. TaxID=49181 RepID=UPI002C2FA929|nr:cytochrome c [Zoogloea sp.]HMV62182.1 cytochrome c [Rhodocyclaceae bacterium]HMW51848.1 cytochrome c [Rhodocyclaceae bacterium]HMY49981.1 cytochrome c [Rhodocyclaceae bacterium]HMZ77811.1 cytochrome c [Rhodocyclaceae bacterium]HNC78695.1 cytochrome c [Rhodocyclaceae bacterium]
MWKIRLTCAIACLGAALAQAADPVLGEKLAREHRCADCHRRLIGGDGSALYTRPDRKVTSRDKLTAQVSFCSSQLKTGWFPEEEEAVAAWLNQRYYHFR